MSSGGARKLDHHGHHHLHSKASRMIHTLVSWLHGDGGADYHPVDNGGGAASAGVGGAAAAAAAAEGTVPVYVGPNEERFLVKLRHINHPLFRKLLELTEMELGFCDNCRLVIPCDVGVFKRVISRIDADDHHHRCKKAPAAAAAAAISDEELLRVFESICRGSS